MATPAQSGQFVWYDLTTTDIPAAKTFYTAVIGWGTLDWTPPEGNMPPYTMWTVKGTPVGGVMTIPDKAKQMGAPPHWVPYISTADVGATIAKVKELGGKLLDGPDSIPTVGEFAVFQDPQGAVFMVFKPANPAADKAPDQKLFSWHELHTTDHVKALEFYSKLFGWEKTDAMDMGAMGTYQMYGANGETYGGMFNSPMPRPAWLLYASVDDADSATNRVTEHGGKVLNGPMDVPNNGGRIAQCMDPQGAMFAVHSAPRGA